MSESFGYKNALFSILVAFIAAGGALWGAKISGESQIQAMREAAIENQQSTIKIIEANLEVARITAANNIKVTQLAQEGSFSNLEKAHSLRLEEDRKKNFEQKQNAKLSAAIVLEADLLTRINAINVTINIFRKANLLMPDIAGNGDLIIDDAFNVQRVMAFKIEDLSSIMIFIEKMPSEIMYESILFYRGIQTVEQVMDRLINRKINKGLYEFQEKLLSWLDGYQPKNQTEQDGMQHMLAFTEKLRQNSYKIVTENARGLMLHCSLAGYRALAGIYKDVLVDKSKANEINLALSNITAEINKIEHEQSVLQKEYIDGVNVLAKFHNEWMINKSLKIKHKIDGAIK